MSLNEQCHLCWLNGKQNVFDVTNFRYHLGTILLNHLRFLSDQNQYESVASQFDNNEKTQEIKSCQKVLMFSHYILSRGVLDLLKHHLPMTVKNDIEYNQVTSGMALLREVAFDLQVASDIFNIFSTIEQKKAIEDFLSTENSNLQAEINEHVFTTFDKLKIRLEKETLGEDKTTHEKPTEEENSEAEITN